MFMPNVQVGRQGHDGKVKGELGHILRTITDQAHAPPSIYPAYVPFTFAQLVSEGDIVSDLYMVIEGEVVVIDGSRGGGGSDSNGASMGASIARTNSGGGSFRR